MTQYYFDIETWDPNATGRPDPMMGQVIAVAYQPMSFGMPTGDLEIKKAWGGSSEKTVLKHVLDLGIFDWGPNCFAFVPVGTNLDFDFAFLMERMHRSSVCQFDRQEVLEILREKPRIDIKTTLVLMNDGGFRGSSLGAFTRLKKGPGATVLKLWEKRDYHAIEEYIRSDAAAFFDVYQKMLPVLLDFGRTVRPSGRPR
jgi:hypothetical protein